MLFVRDGAGAIRGGSLGYVWGDCLHILRKIFA
jgi:hypothetical protein